MSVKIVRTRGHGNPTQNFRRPVPAKTKRQIRREVKSQVMKNIESKNYDSDIVWPVIDWVGFGSTVTSAITQGPADNQYIGNKITPTHLTVRGLLARNDITAAQPLGVLNAVQMRMIIIQHRTNVVPTSSQLLQAFGSNSVPISPINVDHDNQFRVLIDRLWTLNYGHSQAVSFKVKIGMKKLQKIWFSDAVGTLERGLIRIYFFSNVNPAIAAADQPSAHTYSRLFFKDA